MNKITWREIADAQQYKRENSGYIYTFVEFLRNNTYYEYFAWNGWVYCIEEDGSFTQTSLKVDDIAS